MMGYRSPCYPYLHVQRPGQAACGGGGSGDGPWVPGSRIYPSRQLSDNLDRCDGVFGVEAARRRVSWSIQAIWCVTLVTLLQLSLSKGNPFH